MSLWSQSRIVLRLSFLKFRYFFFLSISLMGCVLFSIYFCNPMFGWWEIGGKENENENFEVKYKRNCCFGCQRMRVKSTKSNCCLRLILDEVLICWVLEWWLILDPRNFFPLHFSWNLAEHMGILILYVCVLIFLNLFSFCLGFL